jgi:DNA adenine methylase
MMMTVFFYIDPPYICSDQGHYAGYTHEDFTDLLTILPELKGTFLLSSYPDESLDRFRKKNGWNALDLSKAVSVNNVNPRKTVKTECLTWNYDIQAEEGVLF